MNASILASALARDHAVTLTDWVRTVRVTLADTSALLVDTVAGIQVLADDGREVAFTVPFSTELAERAAAGERAAVVSAWFWPVTWWTLRRRRARDWLVQLGEEVENVVHFHLPHGTFTALHINAEWVWVPGEHALASRVFTLSTADMLEWLDAAVRATTSGNDRYWEWFTPWYNGFRARTSTWHPNAERQLRLLDEFRRYDHTDEPEESWPGWEDW